MDKSKKKEVVDWVKQATAENETVVFASFSGLSVEAEGQLRSEMRAADGVYKVVKNTLLKLGLQDRVEEGDLESLLVGTTSVAISTDPVGISKALKQFMKENESITLKGALLGNKLVGPDAVKQLADLPSKEQMLGQLVGMLQQPMTQLAGVLSAPMRDLAGVLNQVQQQKN